jgi:hypothetical protein
LGGFTIMKQQRIASSLFLLLGIILGMMPPIAYHLISTRQPPAPISPWDSRPCRAAPSPLTCDGILPYAPGDFVAVAHGKKIPGEAACMDQREKQYHATLTDAKGNYTLTGAITLWWLPSCQSATAETTWISDEYAVPMIAELIVILPGNRWISRGQRMTTTSAKVVAFLGNSLWTTLMWIRPGASIVACGSAVSGKSTYRACTQIQQISVQPTT